MSATNRPNHPCSNPHCGNTLYEATYGWSEKTDMDPVWRCTNCGQDTPRITRQRKTLSLKRWDVYHEIKNAWNEVDEELFDLCVGPRVPNGCLLVYLGHNNYHLNKIVELDKITRRDLVYHGLHAKLDLQRAKDFLASKEVYAYA